MAEKNYISIDGNGNISLQDINGRDININDISAIKQVFENTEPEYIKKLFKQIDDNYNQLVQKNEQQISQIIALLQQQIDKKGISITKSKNIVTAPISNVSGNVHIGDIIYNNSEPEKPKENSNKNDLKRLVSENQIDVVFAKLKLYNVDKNTLFMLKAQWNDLKMQKIMGTLTNSEISVLTNKTRIGILQFIETI